VKYAVVINQRTGVARWALISTSLFQRAVILAQPLKSTTRKAYAIFKTFGFLRSCNVKESLGNLKLPRSFVERPFQPCTR
jgi:hypothetical protein